MKDDILMGYKGNSLMDCGYFYAPYVGLTSTPVVGGSPQPSEQEEDRGSLVPKWVRRVYRSIDDPWESPDFVGVEGSPTGRRS